MGGQSDTSAGLSNVTPTRKKTFVPPARNSFPMKHHSVEEGRAPVPVTVSNPWGSSTETPPRTQVQVTPRPSPTPDLCFQKRPGRVAPGEIETTMKAMPPASKTELCHGDRRFSGQSVQSSSQLSSGNSFVRQQEQQRQHQQLQRHSLRSSISSSAPEEVAPLPLHKSWRNDMPVDVSGVPLVRSVSETQDRFRNSIGTGARRRRFDGPMNSNNVNAVFNQSSGSDAARSTEYSNTFQGSAGMQSDNNTRTNFGARKAGVPHAIASTTLANSIIFPTSDSAEKGCAGDHSDSAGIKTQRGSHTLHLPSKMKSQNAPRPQSANGALWFAMETGS